MAELICSETAVLVLWTLLERELSFASVCSRVSLWAWVVLSIRWRLLVVISWFCSKVVMRLRRLLILSSASDVIAEEGGRVGCVHAACGGM